MMYLELAALVFLSSSGRVHGWTPPNSTLLTVSTYNVGGVPFVPFMEERLAWFADNAVEEFEGDDVICLQETFLVETQESIRAAFADEFPYSYTMIDEPSLDPAEGAAACPLNLLQDLGACLAEGGPGSACGTASSIFSLAVCIDESCPPASDGSYESLYEALKDTGCTQCLISKSTGPAAVALDEAFGVCAALPAQLYRETLGLMILSKHELTDTAFIESDTFFSRGAIAASVLDGRVRVACTHLESTTHFSSNGTVLRTVVELQRLTVDDTMSILGDAENTIITGDLNAGRASQFESHPYNEYEEDTIDYIEGDLGYKEVYTRRQFGGRVNGATWEPVTNLVASLQGWVEALAIDHVYVRGPDLWPLRTARRFLDESPVEVDIDGTQTLIPASDHYGARTSILVK